MTGPPKSGLLMAALFVSGCGGALTDTAVVGPSEPRCAATIRPSTTTFSHQGGSGSIAVSASRECQWTAAAEAAWIRLSPATGQGEAVVTLTITPNTHGTSRTSAVRVNDQRVQLAQEGAPCRVELTGPRDTLRASGEEATIAVSVPEGCAWTARTGASWISVVGNSTGSGPGTVQIRLSPNHGPERQGAVAVGNASIAIQQSGQGSPTDPPAPPSGPPPSDPPPAPPPPPPPPPPPVSCSFELDRSSASYGADGGSGRVKVKTTAACAWTTSSGAGWLTIESGASGSGDGEVRYRVAPNESTTPRTTVLLIGGVTLTVDQEGAKPPKPEKVEVEGNVGALSGSCPTLSFKVQGTPVVTTAATRFKDGSCADLRNGMEVKVKGERQGSGPIVAKEVEIDD